MVSGFFPVGAGDFAQNAMPFMEIAFQQRIVHRPKGCAGRKVQAVPSAALKQDQFLELSGTLQYVTVVSGRAMVGATTVILAFRTDPGPNER